MLQKLFLKSMILSLTSISLITIPQLMSAEIDNYFLEGFDTLEDSTQLWNDHVNNILDETISQWNSQKRTLTNRSESLFVKNFYRNLDGHPLKNKTNPWSEKNLDNFKFPSRNGLYSTIPLFPTFAVTFNLRFGNLPVGVDKLTHYLGAGYQMYKKAFLNDKGVEKAIEWAEMTEATFLGRWFSGTFSNGDLVADYEGMRFFRTLFHDNYSPSKGPYLKFEDGKVIRLRDYDIHEYLSPFWNEAINPSNYRKKVVRRLERLLTSVCDLYSEFPHYYQISPNQRKELEARYAHLPIRYNPNLLLENICPEN